MRKRICVLLAQLEEKTQKSFMKAFLKEAYSCDYDVCIFSMYQKFQERDLRDIGDSNIYSLINFKEFDGVVILLDTILTPGFEEKLLARVKEEFNGPVIVVDKQVEDFEYILIDHYTPIKKIMNHLIDDHGYKDIAFLGGKEGHPHSVQRLNAYLDTMKAHNLKVNEDHIYHGNYWYDTGSAFAEILLKDKKNLPEAVMCANEYMAIGLAATLTENGLKIPGDIALAAYDSTEEGVTAPVPLTSADIPAGACGKLCFAKIHSAISKEEYVEPDINSHIIIGGSCGCKNFKSTYKRVNRDFWKTDNSAMSFYSDFNHITEDLLCQTHFDKFFEMLAVYSYQIRPFNNFWLCMNEGFRDPNTFIGSNARRSGYASTMNMVIKCGKTLPDQDKEAVNFNRIFKSSQMIPELYEDRDYPTTFIFTPVFFDDRCFGYAVLNYGESLDFYDETFRVWMRNINQCIEAFYRQKALSLLVEQIKAEQIRDKQTGLYNYTGFFKGLNALVEENIAKGRSLAIIAIDINNLTDINEKYNRIGGDSAIIALAKFISGHTHEREICGRLSNDEFLIGIVDIDCDNRYKELISLIPEQGIAFYDTEQCIHYATLHHNMKTVSLNTVPDIDFIINQAVNDKNHAKKIVSQKDLALSEMSEEDIAKCNEVEKILDNNLLKFYFQPIVKAENGDIFGYEALMRYEGEMKLNPLEIIKYAASLNRLYDIEKLTFNGVLDCMEEDPAKFISKKVFINSLPAHQLEGEDEENLFTRFKRHLGRIVVEYTEASEFSDDDLNKRKADYSSLYVEIALDDYGSGYSNVNNLIRYNPRYVKVDHALIQGIDNNAQKRHFVKNIISYASKSNISVLAEGVETKEELRTVIDLGVNYIQGFYTGRPVKEPVQKISDEICSQMKRFSYGNDTSSLNFDDNLFG